MVQFSLDDLARIIAARSHAGTGSSYTKSLLDAGIRRSAKKFGEESVELVIASISEDREAIIAEAADVLYHLLVILRASDVSVSDVYAELEKRTAQSGLEEKASREGQ